MKTGRGIDHIGLASRSLDELAAKYEGLGFTLTPRAYHPDHMGTSNRLVQFAGRNFLELIELDRPDGVSPLAEGVMSFGANTRDFLSRREGINLVVFRTDDRDADLARWTSAGLNVFKPFNFERLATLPDGSQQVVRFELAFVTHPQIDVLFFVCHNKAQAHFWKPQFQTHPNGAQSIEAAVIASKNPGRDAEFLSKLFDGQIAEGDGCLSVACEDNRLDIVSPERLSTLGWSGDLSQGSVAAGFQVAGSSADGSVKPDEAGGAFIQWT
jgi:catechol 2,3-dioxygenase-like lactoylglutathione lyase family enzyme